MTAQWIKRPLSTDEMAEIISGVESAATKADALVCAVFGVADLALNEIGESTEDYTAERRLDMTRILIPQGQWKVLCDALIERGKRDGDALSATNLGLDWVNVGPSSYEADDDRVHVGPVIA